MAQISQIQWTDATWNIAIGCTKVDEDCKYCYMYRDSMKGTRYKPNEVTQTKTVFTSPLKWKEPKKIFTSSLTDFFHEDCDSFRNEAWDIIRKCPQHTFQILTKRPERISSNLPTFWSEIKGRVWIGTSVGHMNGMTRLYDLLESGANCLYFLSLEPLHGAITLPLYDTYGRDLNRYKIKDALSWVIVGGESGNQNGLYKYRECKLEWIESIVNQCAESDIPIFVKQMGTYLSKELKMSDRHGGNIDEFPKKLQVRLFPSKKLF